MSSFFGAASVLFLLRFRLDTFTEAAALRSIVLRSSMSMRPDSHTCFSFSFEMSLFPSIFVPLLEALTVFSLNGEYVARFPLPDSIFLPCDHGLDFYISLCENSINQTKIK